VIALVVMPEPVFLLTKTHVSSYSFPFPSLKCMFGLSTRKSRITVQLLTSKIFKNYKFIYSERAQNPSSGCTFFSASFIVVFH